jgi:hypothetical protein
LRWGYEVYPRQVFLRVTGQHTLPKVYQYSDGLQE